MTRVVARLLGALLCVCGCLVAPACAIQPDAAAPAAPDALPWPDRAATLVREIEVGPWTLRWVGESGLGWLEADRGDAGLIAAELDLPADAVDFEGEGSIVVRMPEGELSRTARLAGKPAAAYEFLSADPREGDAMQLQRTWFALYEPRHTEPDSEDAKGVVVLLPGMFGTPEPVIDSLVGQLRDRGWHVLRMLTHSSRFTEKASYTLDPSGDIDATAATIAADFGDRAAECAIATEAVCAHIAETRPDVPIGARIGLGMSGGGMVLPTVIAREPAPYRAAVFVGGGCDFAAIAMESNYTDWIDAVRIAWRDGVTTPEAAERFTRAYRAAAPLDSYRTAPRMAGIPILMLHGETDRAVPTHLGELLWERLGKPERWTAPAGHEVLFLAFLPAKAPALLDWLDALQR